MSTKDTATAGELAVAARAALDGLQPTAPATASRELTTVRPSCIAIGSPRQFAALRSTAATQYRRPRRQRPVPTCAPDQFVAPSLRSTPEIIPRRRRRRRRRVRQYRADRSRRRKGFRSCHRPDSSSCPSRSDGADFRRHLHRLTGGRPPISAANPKSDFQSDPPTWVVRSFCDRSGCVASATTVDSPTGYKPSASTMSTDDG